MAFQAFTGIAITDLTDHHSPNDHRQAGRSMEVVDHRVASFTNWPHSARFHPFLMAGNGFYQCGVNTDAVACFNCKVVIKGWKKISNLVTAHRRRAPHCSWNNGTYMEELDERYRSFHSWPMDVKPLRAAMAMAGFYHSDQSTDAVTCFSCNQVFMDWKKQDDPVERHRQQSRSLLPCAWISKVTTELAQHTLLTPPPTPPLPASASIPHKCKACQSRFPSSNSFHRHRRQLHKKIHGRIGVRLERPEAVRLGRHKVLKSTKQRKRNGRKNNTDLFGRD